MSNFPILGGEHTIDVEILETSVWSNWRKVEKNENPICLCERL